MIFDGANAMSANEPLYSLIKITTNNLSREENRLLEADIFVRVCNELKTIFRQHYQNYFRLMNFNLSMEDIMLEENFIRSIINDILATGDYTLKGIAYYTDTHEDIILDLASGLNNKPLAICLRKTIELHKTVRRELYEAIGKKIISEYLTENI